LKTGFLSLSVSCIFVSGCAYQQTYELSDRVSSAAREVRSESAGFDSESSGILATGYAVIDIQKGQTHAQRRLMAIRASKLDAYRNLAEQVYGLFVESSSQMAELALASESVRARVQGLVYGSRLVSINPVGVDTYETKLALDRTVVDELIAHYRAPVERKRLVKVVSEPLGNERSKPTWSFKKNRWVRNSSSGE
jgi:hypothetical protein